jgi:hypothetical protein
MSERHVAKDLVVPENIRLLRLPPDAPKLNSQEHIWLRKRFDKIMDLHFTFRGVSPMIILIIAPAPLPQGMRTRGLTHLGPTVENPYPPQPPKVLIMLKSHTKPAEELLTHPRLEECW